MSESGRPRFRRVQGTLPTVKFLAIFGDGAGGDESKRRGDCCPVDLYLPLQAAVLPTTSQEARKGWGTLFRGSVGGDKGKRR